MTIIESILNVYAFKLGLIIASIMFLHILISFILSKIFRLRVLEVSIFNSIKLNVLETNIHNTVLKLGWIPMSMALRFDLDDTTQKELQPSYKLTSRSKGLQFILFAIPSIILILIGVFYYPDIEYSITRDFYNSYLDVLFFHLTISEFNAMNVVVFNNLDFIISLVFIITGLVNFISNLNFVLSNSTVLIGLLALVCSVFIALPLYRILFYHFTFGNLLYCLLGANLIGFVTYWVIKELLHELLYD